MTEKTELMGPRPPRGTPEYEQYLIDWAEYKKGPEYAAYLEARAARKATTKEVPPPPPELLAMSVEELNALSDSVDQQRADLMVKKRQVAAVRLQRLLQEQADEWGLTVGEYDRVKEQARADGVVLHAALNQARRDKRKAERQAQTVKPGVASVGTRVTGV